VELRRRNQQDAGRRYIHWQTNLSQNFVTENRKFIGYHLQFRRRRCGEGSRWHNFVAFVYGLSAECATVAN
jgi:hypothetical protein